MDDEKRFRNFKDDKIYIYTFLFLISMSLRDNHVKRTIIKR